MARLGEIAEGLASVLAASPLPEPLFLELKNHSLAKTTFLIRAVVHSCERREAPLSLIRVGATQGANARRALGPEPLAYDGVAIKLTCDLDRRIEFYRFPKDGSE